MEIIEEITNLVWARYSVIYIVSSEEDRVINAISNIPNLDNYEKFVWSYSLGVREYKDLEINDDNNSEGQHTDFMEVLKYIRSEKRKAIYFLNGFHSFMDSERYFDVIRYLKELVRILKYTYKCIIIISPVLQIPTELEKDITVIDFPLPDDNEIHNIYKRIVKDVADNPQIPPIKSTNNESVQRALKGLTENEIQNVLYKSISKHKNFDIDTIVKEKEQIVRKSGILEYYHSQENLGDIGGMEILKEWIVKRKNAFSNDAREYGLRYPRGILLLGVQGAGKSLACKVIAKYWNFPLLKLDIGAVMGGIVGESEENIRKVLKIAEATAPAVLWIDEIEKALAGIQSSSFSDSGTTARVAATILTWLQENKSSVFVAATANSIESLPPELMRKGRLDEIFFVDLPNLKERNEIFEIHIKKRGRNINDYDIGLLADESVNFSGAEIEGVIESAMFNAFDDNKREFTTEDILMRIKESVSLYETMNEKIEGMRKWVKGRARNASKINKTNKKTRSIEVQ